MRVWILLLVLPIAGCVSPQFEVEDAFQLRPGTLPDVDDLWFVYMTGCGACFEPDWATVTALYKNGAVHWFAFAPRTLENDSTGDDLQLLRHGAAVAALRDVDAFHTRETYGPFMFGGDTFLQVEAGWPDIKASLEGATRGLRNSPPLENYGCEDCSAPVAAVLGDVTRGGEIMERTPHGGNVPADSRWHVVEQQLALLHEAAREASGWTGWHDAPPRLDVQVFNEGLEPTRNARRGERLIIDATGTQDADLQRLWMTVDGNVVDLLEDGQPRVVHLALKEGLSWVHVEAHDHFAASQTSFWVSMDGAGIDAWRSETALAPGQQPPSCREAEHPLGFASPTHVVPIGVAAIPRDDATAVLEVWLEGPGQEALCLDGTPVGYQQNIDGGRITYQLPTSDDTFFQFVVHAEAVEDFTAHWRIRYPTAATH
ncbi:MAG: hypothetical protein ACPHID_02510 [Thermoplasmatota archaeon]